MKTKIFTTTSLAVFIVLGIVGSVQHVSANQCQKDNSTQSQSNSGMMGSGMMSQMAAHHQQMSGLMNKLTESMASIQSEKDPETLKSKLAEHQKLLDQMHGEMMQQGNMMQMMSGQAKPQCPAAGDGSKAPTK